MVIDVFIDSTGMLVEQLGHVAEVGDRDADLADLAGGLGCVGVVADLGGQVEGDREPGLALGQVGPVELVGGLGRRVARVGAHHPRLVPGRAGSAPRSRPTGRSLIAWSLIPPLSAGRRSGNARSTLVQTEPAGDAAYFR